MSVAIKDGAYTAASRVLAQVFQFTIFLVAVRVLTPAEFGLFALVSAWTIILAQFSSTGWPEYIMQWSGEVRRVQEVLTVSLLGGTALASLLLVAAFAIPMSSPQSKLLLQVLALSVPFIGLGGTYSGVLVWQNRLRALALVSVLSEIAGLTVAVWALIAGQGVLALAYGRLAGTIVWTFAGVAMVRKGPVLPVPLEHVIAMSQFAVRIIAVRLIVNVRLYSATLLVGAYLGAAEAGFFRAAQRLVGALSEVLGEPTRVLSWTLFRAAKNEQGGRANFRDQANSLFSVVMYCSIPLFATLAILADDVVNIVFGPGWEPTIAVVRILAIGFAFAVAGYASEAILSLAGKVRLLPWLAAIYAVFGVGLTLLVAPLGMAAISWAQVAWVAVIFVVNGIVHRRLAGVHWEDIALRLRMLPVAFVAMLGTAWAMPSFEQSAGFVYYASFVLNGVLLLLVFGAVAFLGDPNLRKTLKALLARRKQS